MNALLHTNAGEAPALTRLVATPANATKTTPDNSAKRVIRNIGTEIANFNIVL